MAMAKDGQRGPRQSRAVTSGDRSGPTVARAKAGAKPGAKAAAKPGPCLGAVAHAGGDAARSRAGRRPETEPLPVEFAHEPIDEKSPAQWAYERLILYIKAFEERLDANEEVAVGFVGSDIGVLGIETLGYFAPDLISFEGLDEAGVRTQLVQHVSQMSVMLRALPKPENTGEPRRIGFDLAARLATRR